MPRRSVLHVHSILLQMIRQDFTHPVYSNGPGKEKSHIWEVRHAGLLGIKYEVAVRSDVVEAGVIKEEVTAQSNVAPESGAATGLAIKTESVDVDVGKDHGLDMKADVLGIKTEILPLLSQSRPQRILQDVVDAAVLGQVLFLFESAVFSRFCWCVALVTVTTTFVRWPRLV
jgi:hypothetical protein